MKHSTKRLLVAGGLGLGVVGLVAGTATASSLITSAQIKDGAVHRVDVTPSINRSLDRADAVPGIQSQLTAGGAALSSLGAQVAVLPKHGLDGAYYSIAKYDSGDTNGGAIATVACDNPTDVAISGGVQTLGIDGGVASPTASSFPGRMDWSTNSPKAGRLDGWIVQFDGAAPMKANLWALCLPGSPITAKVTYTESGQ